MSTDLNIHLSPEAFVALQQAALATGRTPDDVAAAALEQKFGPVAKEADASGGRIEDFFGAVSFGYKGGVTNEQIDADLAREYGRTHDGD